MTTSDHSTPHSEQLVISIENWERYNPRSDVKRSSWFRFEHSFFEDYKFYDFSLEEKAVWFYFLCEISKANSHRDYPVNAQHAHRVAGISSELLHRAIKKLQQHRVITVRTLRGRYAAVTHTAPTRRDETRRSMQTDSSFSHAQASPTTPPPTPSPFPKIVSHLRATEKSETGVRAGLETVERLRQRTGASEEEAETIYLATHSDIKGQPIHKRIRYLATGTVFEEKLGELRKKRAPRVEKRRPKILLADGEVFDPDEEREAARGATQQFFDVRKLMAGLFEPTGTMHP